MKLDESKRSTLLLATSVAALGTGIAAYWWQGKNEAESISQSPQNDLQPNLWEQVFETQTGTKFELASLRAKPLLINFWATWCPPVQILGLAVDKVEAVSTFLRKTPLSFPIAITGASGISLSKSWGNLSSGLPFSILLDANGRIMQRKMGKLNGSDLSTWLTALQSQK